MPGDAISTSGPETAAKYDSWFETPWGRYAADVEFGLIAAALEPAPKARVLDVGCGAGRFGEKLAELGADLVGVDLDSSMLGIAQRRLQRVALADAHHLPFEDGTFDKAFAVTLCEFSGDPEGVIDEIARVTRTGGRIVIGLLNKRSPWGWLRRRRLSRPPWRDATFIDAEEFMETAGRIGTVSRTSGLFSPAAALPGFISQMVEATGSRLLPGIGAFQVITVVRR